MSDGKNILLVDDDPDIHAAIRMILEPHGYQVACCTTASQGLSNARKMKPDAVLLDIMLADPTEGFHVAYEMKQDEALRDIPIIMISAIGRTVEMDFAKEVGTNYLPAVSFIEKPFDAKTVLEALQSALALHPASAK